MFPQTKTVAETAMDAPGNFTVFSNPAPITPADRASNNAGTNPGIPTTNYPSVITVSGLSGVVTKVTVTFAITSTFPDDLDILLVGPTGAMSLVMSDAGGSGDHTNITYTFDQTAAALMPNDPTTVTPSGTFRPSNYAGFATPEPGGQDNFPTAGGLMSYPADFSIFNGTNPNGDWKLYVVDDQVIDTNSLPGGWSIDITSAIPAATASISGRITSQSSGAGLGGVRVVLTGGGLTTPRIAITNPFGYYRFDLVPQNQTYTVTVASKTHQFSNSSQTVSLTTSDVTNADFVGTP
ncbi:MAG TPA: carboxypeptidase-like regulatory domain-containing protein [Pyrinomonadaceae bacterium]